MNFNESSIPVLFAQNLDKENLVVATTDVHKVYDCLFIAASEFLGLVKNKENAVALVMKDLKGNFKIAWKVEFFANENKEMPGNWTYVIVLDEKDLEGCSTYLTTDTQFTSVMRTVSAREYNMYIEPEYLLEKLIELAVKLVIDWMDVNAKVGKRESLELEGKFKASVEVENDVKIMSITPAEDMKVKIKGDDGIEK